MKPLSTGLVPSQEDDLVVPNLRIRESGRRWFRQWLVAYSAPNHYLNQCRIIVNWTLSNKFQWSFSQNTKLFFTKMYLKVSTAKWRPFYRGEDELISKGIRISWYAIPASNTSHLVKPPRTSHHKKYITFNHIMLHDILMYDIILRYITDLHILVVGRVLRVWFSTLQHRCHMTCEVSSCLVLGCGFQIYIHEHMYAHIRVHICVCVNCFLRATLLLFLSFRLKSNGKFI